MAEVCDLFARRVTRDGKVLISALHKDLLGLSNIVKTFDRRRANRAFYLSKSKKFEEDFGSRLVRDEEGEVILPSLYEEARNSFGDDVTFDNIKRFLNDKYSGYEDLPYQAAYDRMIRFNKEQKGARTFMATIKLLDNGSYRFSIEYNTEKEQLALINTIAEMLTAMNITLLLTRNDVSVQAGSTSGFINNPSKALQGINLIISLTEGASFDLQQDELADSVGQYLIGIYGNDNTFVKRLRNAIKGASETIIKDILGDEDLLDRFNLAVADDDLEIINKCIDEAAAKMIGYYLRNYEKIRPKGLLGNISHLISKFLDFVKTHWISRNRYDRALYDAKYKAFGLALTFMGKNFKVKFTNLFLHSKVSLMSDDAAFKYYVGALKQLNILAQKTKGLGSKVLEDIASNLASFIDSYQSIANTFEERRKSGIGTELVNPEINSKMLPLLVNIARFISERINEGANLMVTTWLNSYDEEKVSMSDFAKVLLYNTNLYNAAVLILSELLKAKNSIAEAGDEAALKTLTDFIKTLEDSLARISYSDSKIVEGELTEINEEASYVELIKNCRRALCILLLNKINGSEYLAIENYVSVFPDKGKWYQVKRNKANVIRLSNELYKTDINPPYQVISRWLDSMADSPDLINKMMYDCIEEQKHKANIKTLALRERLRALYQAFSSIEYHDTEKFIDDDGNESFRDVLKKVKSTEMFFERYNSQLNKYGDTLIEGGQPVESNDLTGNLISERNWGEWERERKIAMKIWSLDYWEKSIGYKRIISINSAGEPIKFENFKYGDSYVYNGKVYTFGTTRESRAEYRKHFYDFINTNTIQISKLFNSKRDMYSSSSYLSAYGTALLDWHKDNSVEIQYKDKDGKVKLDEENNPITIFVPALALDGKKNAYNNSQWNILRDDRNKALKEWYDEYIKLKRELDDLLPLRCTNPLGYRAPQFMGTTTNRLHNALGGDNTGKALGLTLAQNVLYSIGKISPDDVEFGGEHNTFDIDDVEDDRKSLIFDKDMSNSLNLEERLPIFGVKKLSNLNQLSTDLMHSTLAYSAMVYNYNALQEVVWAAELLKEGLLDRKVASDTAVRDLKKEDTPASYDRFESYMKLLLYNDYGSKQHRVPTRTMQKLFGKFVAMSSLLYLGGNIHSATVNAITGLTELYKEAWAGSDFLVSTLWWAMGRYIRGWAWSFINKCGNIGKEAGSTIEDRTKDTLFLRLMNTLNDNERDFMHEHMETPGYSITLGYSMQALCMLPYTITDKWMMSISFMASAKHMKLIHKDDIGKEKPRKKSLWDLYEKAERTKTISGKKVKEAYLKCSDGEFSDWVIEKTNITRIKQLMLKMAEKYSPEVRMAKTEEAKQAALKGYFNQDLWEFYTDKTNEYAVWDEKEENRFRLKCRGINNRMHGIYNRGDGGSLLGNIIGPMLLTLKKYAIGMFDRRFARATYDYRALRIRQGSTTTFWDMLIDMVVNVEGYSGESDNPLSWIYKLDTTVVIRNVWGLINLLYMYINALQHFSGNDYRRNYLRKRGYSDELIRNIDRTVGDWAAIFIDNFVLTICLPPEDGVNFDEMNSINRSILTLYRLFLKIAPGKKTINDDYYLLELAFVLRDKSESNTVPFSLTGMAYYFAYRALKEQYAYNVLLPNSWKYGAWPEFKSLTDSLLPPVSGVLNLITLFQYVWPVVFDLGVTLQELNERAIEEPNIFNKYDIGKTVNPYGAEIYQRGYNKDWYKYAVFLLKYTPYIRSFRTLENGYMSATNSDWASHSDLTKNAPYWKGGGIEGLKVGIPGIATVNLDILSTIYNAIVPDDFFDDLHLHSEKKEINYTP